MFKNNSTFCAYTCITINNAHFSFSVKTEIQEKHKTSLKIYIGELYYTSCICVWFPLKKITDAQIDLNDGLFRRVRANFEHLILHTLYVENANMQHFFYIDWTETIIENQIQKAKLPDDFYERCREYVSHHYCFSSV